MNTKNKIIRNIFSNWANLFVNLVISFFIAPFVVHKLGNAYYGIWVILMQFTGYLYLLDFGVRESIIRYVSRHEASGDTRELNEIISSGILLYGLFAAICLIISAILSWLFPIIFNIEEEHIDIVRIVVIISGFTIGQTLVFNVFGGILMGLQRYDIFNKIGIISAFFRLGLIYVFLSLGYNLIALALIQLAVGLGNNLFIYYFSRKLLIKHNMPFKYIHSKWEKRKKTLGKLYNYSIYVLINNLGQKAIFYTDALLIGIFLSASSVTFYAIAGNLIEYLRRLILLANSVLNPATSELESKQQMDKVSNILIQGSRFSIIAALPICIVYIIMGREFIQIWMGSEYSGPSGDVLIILTLTTLLAIPHSTISSVLYGLNKHKLMATLRSFEALANLTLSLILVNYLGIIGVALGTAIPQFLIMAVLLPALSVSRIDFSLTKYFISVYILPTVAGIPFALSCYFINKLLPTDSLLVFFLQVAIMLPVYIITVLAVCISRDERTTVYSTINKLIPINKIIPLRKQ